MGFGEGLGRAMAAEERAQEEAKAAEKKDWFTGALEGFSEVLAKTIDKRIRGIEERAEIAQAKLLEAQANTLAEKLSVFKNLVSDPPEGGDDLLNALMTRWEQKITDLRAEAKKLRENTEAIQRAATEIDAAEPRAFAA
jgi:c-di-GMP-related signal transduction protein